MSEYQVNESLKRLRGIPQTERHHDKLEESKCSADCSLWNVLFSHWNLMLCSNKIQGGEDCLSMRPSTKLCMWKIGYRLSVQLAAVATITFLDTR
jgi:hypothetical protein